MDRPGRTRLSLPVRLDGWLRRWVPTGSEPVRSVRHELDMRSRLLGGWWMAATAVLGGCLAGVAVAVEPDTAVLTLFGLITAVPGGMALLRGVVDVVRGRDGLHRYTTSTAAFLACYIVAAAGLVAAFAAP